ncbi:hypothetical protein B0H11DRAFT_2385696 [Mycena galericulata]|nr:hypothetical protein B0H11DRAFT_2385696 [Mycena galericulata]
MADSMGKADFKQSRTNTSAPRWTFRSVRLIQALGIFSSRKLSLAYCVSPEAADLAWFFYPTALNLAAPFRLRRAYRSPLPRNPPASQHPRSLGTARRTPRSTPHLYPRATGRISEVRTMRVTVVPVLHALGTGSLLDVKTARRANSVPGVRVVRGVQDQRAGCRHLTYPAPTCASAARLLRRRLAALTLVRLRQGERAWDPGRGWVKEAMSAPNVPILRSWADEISDGTGTPPPPLTETEGRSLIRFDLSLHPLAHVVPTPSTRARDADIYRMPPPRWRRRTKRVHTRCHRIRLRGAEDDVCAGYERRVRRPWTARADVGAGAGRQLQRAQGPAIPDSTLRDTRGEGDGEWCRRRVGDIACFVRPRAGAGADAPPPRVSFVSAPGRKEREWGGCGRGRGCGCGWRCSCAPPPRRGAWMRGETGTVMDAGTVEEAAAHAPACVGGRSCVAGALRHRWGGAAVRSAANARFLPLREDGRRRGLGLWIALSLCTTAVHHFGAEGRESERPRFRAPTRGGCAGRRCRGLVSQ